jgi:hypothetical protein
MVKFKNGLFKGFEINDVFGDIADHEYIDPPYPQKELLDGPFYQGYTFRDANFEANFPETAEEILKMYRLTDMQTNIDGVFAVNLNILEDVLEIIGDIEVEGLTFTAENSFELLEFSLNNIDYHNVEEIKNRKGILKPLGVAMIKKAVFSPLKWRDLSDMVVKNLNEKNIQLHFFNTGLQNKIDDKGWSGVWPEPKGDFLAVVEANLAGLKSDRYIKRDVDYRLQFWENIETGDYSLNGTVTITMEHVGDYNVPISGLYNGYIRLYMPKGTLLKDSNVDVNQVQDDNYSVYGDIVSLKPGERKTLTFNVELPNRIFNGEDYHLDIVKQSGTFTDNYSVVIEAPQGVILTSNNFETREHFAMWQGVLNKDLSLDFKVLPDELGPRIAYTEMRSLEEILIVFNERMAESVLTEPLNITLEDLDITDPEHHDTISIKNARLDYRDLYLEISGMTNQPEEFYQLTIKSAYDVHGNPVQPTPKKITLVQRLTN